MHCGAERLFWNSGAQKKNRIRQKWPSSLNWKAIFDLRNRMEIAYKWENRRDDMGTGIRHRAGIRDRRESGEKQVAAPGTNRCYWCYWCRSASFYHISTTVLSRRTILPSALAPGSFPRSPGSWSQHGRPALRRFRILRGWTRRTA